MEDLIPIIDKLANFGIGFMIVFGVVFLIIFGVVLMIILDIFKQIKDESKHFDKRRW